MDKKKRRVLYSLLAAICFLVVCWGYYAEGKGGLCALFGVLSVLQLVLAARNYKIYQDSKR